MFYLKRKRVVCNLEIMLSNVIFGCGSLRYFDHTQCFKDLPPQRKIPRSATVSDLEYAEVQCPVNSRKMFIEQSCIWQNRYDKVSFISVLKCIKQGN